MVNNSFAEASEIEREGMLVLTPYLKKICDKAEFIITGKSWFAQKCLGDVLARYKGTAKFIEIKVEQKHTGNLFLETWSNRSQLVPGWMYTCHADLLWYYFLDESKLYSVQMQILKAWAFGAGESQGNIYGHPERVQGVRSQLNDTWGRVVPVSKLREYCATFNGPIDPRTDAGQKQLRQEVLFA